MSATRCANGHALEQPEPHQPVRSAAGIAESAPSSSTAWRRRLAANCSGRSGRGGPVELHDRRPFRCRRAGRAARRARRGRGCRLSCGRRRTPLRSRRECRESRRPMRRAGSRRSSTAAAATNWVRPAPRSREGRVSTASPRTGEVAEGTRGTWVSRSRVTRLESAWPAAMSRPKLWSTRPQPQRVEPHRVAGGDQLARRRRGRRPGTVAVALAKLRARSPPIDGEAVIDDPLDPEVGR